ncbi:hypothetical protein BD413DRAFT_583757 [Trametes elegans]|nr:hypothetical protein BD413DRAFT_583757 [Trametes elegans]
MGRMGRSVRLHRSRAPAVEAHGAQPPTSAMTRPARCWPSARLRAWGESAQRAAQGAGARSRAGPRKFRRECARSREAVLEGDYPIRNLVCDGGHGPSPLPALMMPPQRALQPRRAGRKFISGLDHVSSIRTRRALRLRVKCAMNERLRARRLCLCLCLSL